MIAGAELLFSELTKGIERARESAKGFRQLAAGGGYSYAMLGEENDLLYRGWFWLLATFIWPMAHLAHL